MRQVPRNRLVLGLVNEQDLGEGSRELLDESVDRGRTVLSQLMKGASTLDGEWAYLMGFREKEEQGAPEDERVRRSLLRREVVIEEGGVWRLRVPLMGRWLRRLG